MQKKTEIIELDLDDKTLAGIALYAHERDITVNDAICLLLEEYIFINHAIDNKSGTTKKPKKTRMSTTGTTGTASRRKQSKAR